MSNLKREVISKRSNEMELLVFAAISANLVAYSLDMFCVQFMADLKKMPRMSTAMAHGQYRCQLVGDVVEIWHKTEKPRLCCLVTKNN